MVLSLYALAMRAWSSLGAGPEQVTRLSRYGAGWEHVSFIDVGQGHGVLVSAGGESYLIDAVRPEERPNVVDFLRSRA
jgi:beta-lactamase superfamily II metal-dependent hydrolase